MVAGRAYLNIFQKKQHVPVELLFWRAFRFVIIL